MTDKLCIVDDCDYPVMCRHLCQMHYNRWYAGKLDITPPRAMTPAEAGAIGGSAKTPKGFYYNRELARIAGAKGGTISRRTKVQ